MKSYDETMEHILEKSGRELRARARRRRAALSTLSASVAVCAVVCLAYPAAQTRLDEVETGQSSVVSEVQDTDGEDADPDSDIAGDTETARSSTAGDNSTETTYEVVGAVEKPLEALKTVSREELLAYYGVSKLDLAEVLSDYTETNSRYYIDISDYGLYYCPFRWEDATGTKSIEVKFARGPFEYSVGGVVIVYDEVESETTTVNGVEMELSCYYDEFENENRVARFSLNGTSVRVYAQNVDKETFLTALEYLATLEIE